MSEHTERLYEATLLLAAKRQELDRQICLGCGTPTDAPKPALCSSTAHAMREAVRFLRYDAA